MKLFVCVHIVLCIQLHGQLMHTIFRKYITPCNPYLTLGGETNCSCFGGFHPIPVSPMLPTSLTKAWCDKTSKSRRTKSERVKHLCITPSHLSFPHWVSLSWLRALILTSHELVPYPMQYTNK